MMFKRYPFMAEAGDQGGGGGAAAPAPAPTPAAAPSPAATPAPAPIAPAVVAAPTPAPAEAKGYWPDDWRSKAAKGDEKLISRFARYGSPEDALSALVNAQDRISKGELKPVLGKDPTPEQQAEWRQAWGIPETPEKYDVADLGGGLKVSERDKPLIDKVLKAAHTTNQTPEQIKATLRSYYEVVDAVTAKQIEDDKKAEQTGVDALRNEWGAEYRVHANLIENLLAGSSTPELKDTLMNARLPDGTLVKHSPAVQKFLLNLALVQNPVGKLVPSGGNPAQGIREELDRIAKVRNTNRTQYNKDEAMRERERSLIQGAINAGIMDAQGNWKQ